MKDYKETLMLIKFTDGTAKKWLEDRYRMEIDPDKGVVRVYNQVTGAMDFEGYLPHIMYIQYHITKRTPNRFNKKEDSSNNDVANALSDISVEDDDSDAE